MFQYIPICVYVCIVYTPAVYTIFMRILITHRIPDAGLQLLREASFDIDILPDGAQKKHIIRALKKHPYDGMISLLTDAIDTAVLDAAGTNLKIIANYAVGYNNIMVSEARKRGIAITNTPGVLTETVAEHTVALICTVATRIVEGDALVRANRFTGWEPELLLGRDLHGGMLGIVGAGRIGSRVAEILHRAFAMSVCYYDVRDNRELETSLGAVRYDEPEEVLRRSDVLSVHLPLTETTHHFINEKRLSYLKPTALLVNTSRGAVIDEAALTRALARGELFGAGLDVYEHEPAVSRALRKLSNVVLTPHIASASVATRNKMAEMAAKNIISVLHGGEPINPVG